MSSPDTLSIEVTVNGASQSLPHDCMLADLVAQLALAGKRFAIEVNGEIVPRGELADHRLQAGDRIEIVQAIGGG